MRIVTANEFELWRREGRVLEQDGRGAKVIALDDRTILKIFHTRRHPLLARLQPAARRFHANARRLAELGIASPEVLETFWLDKRAGLTGCRYRPVPGESVEQLFREDRARLATLLPSLAAFMRALHDQGIYFRSLHLGNIIHLPQGGFGLIDILDLQFKRRPLSAWLVRRNFEHLKGYLRRRKLSGFPMEELQALYRATA